MKISNLQHIESATEIEVNGGFAAGGCSCRPSYPIRCGSSPYRRSNNIVSTNASTNASANASAQAFGTNTRTYTFTETLVIPGQFSGSRSIAYAEAF
jgi:hypothetical protein